MEFPSSSYLSLPSNPGVYLFLGKKSEILYVGKAKNLKRRVSSYFINRKLLGEKTELLLKKIRKIRVIKTHSEIEALLLEANCIKKYLPPYNIRLTDGKAYPFIRITIKNKYPSILLSRRQDDNKSMYFGPFPNAGAMRLVLKTLRKIFPYQSVMNHPKRICLYYHLGLCPCLPVFDSIENIKYYKKNVKHTIQFLNGRTKKLLKELEIFRKLI